MDELTIITKLTPVPLLILALNVLALGIKKVPKVPNWLIPIILPIVGAALYPFIGGMVPITGIESLSYPAVFYGLIGFVCGGIAVWGHQVVIQLTNRNDK